MYLIFIQQGFCQFKQKTYITDAEEINMGNATTMDGSATINHDHL